MVTAVLLLAVIALFCAVIALVPNMPDKPLLACAVILVAIALIILGL